MRGKDLIVATLFGGAGGSSGVGGGTGGGAVAVSPKEVNFYDYDGTLRYAYTVAEAQALSELPAGPEHPGLVFQGWNWSLEGVKGLTRAMNIGAMYTTDDGTTRLYITLQEGRTSPMLGVGVNGTVTVDWGDGTEPDVLTGTSTGTLIATPAHNYAAPGDYVIRLSVDGEMMLYGKSSGGAMILRHSTSGDNRDRAYQNALQRVEIGKCVYTIGSYAFNNCCSLGSVTIPDSVTSISGYAFQNCYSLKSVTIPDSVTSVKSKMFNFCGSIVSVFIPEGVTDIGNGAFENCYSLGSVTIPDGVTSIGGYLFNSCQSLETIIIPDSVTSIEDYAFQNCYSLKSVTIPDGVTSIGGYLFNSCQSLVSVTITGSVTSVRKNAFQNCYGMSFCDFTACAAVPTLDATSAFTKIPADCEIRVPAALYDEWIAATNWATYASQIKAY